MSKIEAYVLSSSIVLLVWLFVFLLCFVLADILSFVLCCVFSLEATKSLAANKDSYVRRESIGK